ncbi:MAG TPA: dentilisin complex serine proteinase subunit PrtP [Rectinemataceae bacterium]|nr:dentilisin complex serine proteinase subunit PrtP [Rectinemataceae bacterium]
MNNHNLRSSLRSLIAILLAGPVSIALFSACQGTIGSASLATQGSTPAASTLQESQAIYRRLDTNDSAAWASAVQAKAVRQGAVIAKTSSAFDTSLFTGLGATQTGSIAVADGIWRHLAVAAGSEQSLIAALRATPGVLSVEPENILHIPAGEGITSATRMGSATRALGSAILNDPYVSSAEYSLTITHAIDAYSSYPLGGATPKTAYAAVIDTGINLAHQDFNTSSGSIVVRAMSAFSQDSGGITYTYVGDGAPFIDVQATGGTTANWDDDGHGSHVAGIVGAVGNNGLGTAGVMWSGLNLISYKVITDNETVSTGGTAGSGGDWAVYGSLKDLADWWSTPTNHPNAPNQVTLPVNMSLGSSYASPFEIEMIAYALSKKVLVCASMGNDGRSTAEYPAAYSGVIAVGATDGTDALAEFSTTGNWMSVCSPGFDIISTFNGSPSDYEWDSGTSMAAPFVTGLAAYILAYNPNLQPDQVKTIIENTADKIGGETGYSADFGYGRVNVKSAMDLASSIAAGTSTLTSTYSTGTLTIAVSLANSPLTDQKVYLYDSTGAFVEFGYTSDSSYISNNSESGTVKFMLLKPGTYTAAVNYAGNLYTTTAPMAPTGDASATITIP